MGSVLSPVTKGIRQPGGNQSYLLSYVRLQNIDFRQLYERGLASLPRGLARLLVIEKHFNNRSHYYFIRFPGKPLKSLASGTFPTLTIINDDDEEFGSMYEYTPFQIPYALEWDANSIKELSRRTVSPQFLFAHDY